ncbi:MAG TPA: ABC transporter ATP-binding protein [Candidatus Bathyarchaeia archaeon]|nr:ABC transporter ATP-binding protein [Candidatus Bathyarchaeia archaeon]
MIELRGVGKTYRSASTSTAALHGVNLRILRGAFATISGPSGSGKSTLLSIIGGIERADTGTVTVGGRPISGLTERDLADYRLRSVGFIFQAFHLIPNLTAENNVALPMLLAGKDDASARSRARELLRNVGLGAQGTKLPHELSGGEQQRVAIARALGNAPPLLLADEPTGNLDSATGAAIFELLLQAHRGGATLIVVTHEQELAARGSVRIEMLDGIVARVGDDRSDRSQTA